MNSSSVEIRFWFVYKISKFSPRLVSLKVKFTMDTKLSLSTHILDTTRGLPAANVKIKLYKLVGGIWVESATRGSTDKDGRIKEFAKVDESVRGVYKLKFEVSEYFQSLGVETLYPFVEVSGGN
jgi:5-hydroxyisourate hydrolase